MSAENSNPQCLFTLATLDVCDNKVSACGDVNAYLLELKVSHIRSKKNKIFLILANCVI